ncbi:MAG: hypothetical protein ACTSPB_26385, partial [Candidatus Thorarchaeota archaeon]
SSNEGVTQAAVEGGEAEYQIPQGSMEDFQKQFGGEIKDIHPMVLLGCTIQYVRLVGGRLAAHKIIEEVHSALQAMVNDGSPRMDPEVWTSTKDGEDPRELAARLQETLNR